MMAGMKVKWVDKMSAATILIIAQFLLISQVQVQRLSENFLANCVLEHSDDASSY